MAELPVLDEIDLRMLELLQESQPIDLGHLEIGEHYAKSLSRELIEGLLAINGNRDFIAFVPQNGAQPFCNRTVVVRDHYFGALHFSLWNGFFLLARRLI